MSGLEPPAIAEALTLIDCLTTARADALASAEGMGEALASTTQGIPAAALGASQAGWDAAFARMLTIPVGEMFKAAGIKLSVNAPMVEGSAPGSGTITLAPFVVESSHHPTIAVTCAGVVVTLRFDVELSLEVSGAQLRVEARRFVGARTGTSKGVARISYLNLDPPFEVGTPEFELPGALDFARPVAADAAEPSSR